MIFSNNILEAGRLMLVSVLKVLLTNAAFEKRMEAAQNEYSSLVQSYFDDGFDTKEVERITRQHAPNKEQERRNAVDEIEVGVGRRLKIAIEYYEEGLQLECIRHIMLAMSAICNIIRWEAAELYLNNQCRQLHELDQSSEAA